MTADLWKLAAYLDTSSQNNCNKRYAKRMNLKQNSKAPEQFYYKNYSPLAQ